MNEKENTWKEKKERRGTNALMCTNGIHKEVRTANLNVQISLVHFVGKTLIVNRRQKNRPLENKVLRDQIVDDIGRGNRSPNGGLGRDGDAERIPCFRHGSKLRINMKLR